MLAVERGRIAALRRGTRIAPRMLAPDHAAFVPTQAGPLAGDHDVVRLRVGEGAALTIEPVAATVALPGPARTRLELEIHVDGRLVLEDAPLIVAEGADVQRTVTITLGPHAVLWLRDVVVLGRAGERPGRLESVLRVEGPDGVLLHDALRIEPGERDEHVALAPGHRAVATVVCFGEEVEGGERLEFGGRLWRASAASAADVGLTRVFPSTAAASGTLGI